MLPGLSPVVDTGLVEPHRCDKPPWTAAQILYAHRVVQYPILRPSIGGWGYRELGAEHVPWTCWDTCCQGGDSLWGLQLIHFHHHLCSLLHPARLPWQPRGPARLQGLGTYQDAGSALGLEFVPGSLPGVTARVAALTRMYEASGRFLAGCPQLSEPVPHPWSGAYTCCTGIILRIE